MCGCVCVGGVCGRGGVCGVRVAGAGEGVVVEEAAHVACHVVDF